jgi:hypothetical protein
MAGLVFGLIILGPASAWALGFQSADCSRYEGLSTRIVACVQATVRTAGNTIFTDFYPMVANFVAAVLTFGVIVFGIMMAMGMVEKLSRDAMVLLLKVAFVAYFVQNVDMLYAWVIAMVDSLSNIMFTFATVQHPTTPVCIVNKVSVWERVDCLTDTLIGIRTENSAGGGGSSNRYLTGHGLMRGLVAFFGSAFFSSIPGFIIGVIGFLFLYTMVIFMVKALFTYLMAYMALMFLMILAPFFMPMVLFRVTKLYFDTWVKLIIGFALQPVIIVTFVTFAVAAMDVVVFSGQRSFVRTIAGDAARGSGFNLNTYLDQIGAYSTRTIGPEMVGQSSAPSAARATPQRGVAGNVLMTQCGQNVQNAAIRGVGGAVGAAQDCARGWVVGLNLRAIDWEKVAENRSPPVTVSGTETKAAAFMKELMSAAILMAVMMFIINALMRVLPSLANDLVGSATQTPNLFGQATKWDIETRAMGSTERVVANFRSMVGGR